MDNTDVLVQNFMHHQLPQEPTKLSLDNTSKTANWRLVKLGELGELIRGISYEPKDASSVQTSAHLPILRATNIQDRGLLLKGGLIFVRHEKVPNIKLLDVGDIVIAMSSGSKSIVGKSAQLHAEWNGSFGAFCAVFRTRSDVADLAFIGHVFQSNSYRGHISKAARGTNINNLSKEHILGYEFPLPPLAEQCEITRVLNIAQDAIQTRQEELELERERKATLMEYLFTHGTHGEKTKQTEIGEIPESWEVVRLGVKCNIRYGLGQPPALDVNGVPMIRATDIKGGRIVPSTVVRVKREAIPENRNPFLKKGDIIVVRSGAYTGDTAMYDGTWELAIAGYDLVATPAGHEIDMAFITQYLQGNAVQSYFRRRRDRSAQPHLNADQLSNTIIPFPTFVEQCDISSILNGCDNKIAFLEQELSLLEELFRALLEELMTGRLSTLPLIEEGETHE